MSLRIRRGTDAQRLTLTFDQGEVVYTTDTKKVYIGDGVTAGGTNILATSAGTGVTFNATTQAFDFTTSNLGLTTSVVSEGANKYFTTQRAQDAAAALFTAVGSPATTGTIVGTVATGTVTLSATPSPLLEQGEKFTVIGTGGGGLTAGGTYFVISNTGTSVILASSLANAMTSTAITSLSTASLTGTTFSSAGISTGITFTYDSVTHTLTANSTGLTSLVTDSNPSLGGNLAINAFNITGTGSFSGTNISGTGTVSAPAVTGTTSIGTNIVRIVGNAITTTNAGASPNSTDLIIGTAATATSLKIFTNDPAHPSLALQGRTSGGATGTNIEFKTSRGTITVPTTVQVGDAVNLITSFANDGTDYRLTSIMGSFIDPNGTVGTNTLTGLIGLITLADGNPSNVKGVFINRKGWLTVGRAITDDAKAHVDINGAMLLAPLASAPANPVAGMLAIANGTGWNPTSTGKNTLVCYLGSAWVQVAVAA
jgi:hypothetical protein